MRNYDHTRKPRNIVLMKKENAAANNNQGTNLHSS